METKTQFYSDKRIEIGENYELPSKKEEALVQILEYLPEWQEGEIQGEWTVEEHSRDEELEREEEELELEGNESGDGECLILNPSMDMDEQDNPDKDNAIAEIKSKKRPVIDIRKYLP